MASEKLATKDLLLADSALSSFFLSEQCSGLFIFICSFLFVCKPMGKEFFGGDVCWPVLYFC